MGTAKRTEPVEKSPIKLQKKPKPELVHISSPNCWCDPFVDYVDLSTGTVVWTHRMEQ